LRQYFVPISVLGGALRKSNEAERLGLLSGASTAGASYPIENKYNFLKFVMMLSFYLTL
jgi:hypothetical protein